MGYTVSYKTQRIQAPWAEKQTTTTTKIRDSPQTPWCWHNQILDALEYCFWAFMSHLHAKSLRLCPTLCNPMECSLPSSSIHGILQARILEWVVMPSSRGSSQPRDQTQVSHITGRFFTSWATREAQEYWSGSLYLLQKIFPTQELNWGLLHCRWILDQLSYQGSPL